MRETDRSSEKENGKGWLQDQTISSQISHMGLYQHTYWKSNIWFTNKRKHDTKERRIWINMWTDATVYQKRECFQWLARLELVYPIHVRCSNVYECTQLILPTEHISFVFIYSFFTKCYVICRRFFVNNLHYLLKYFDNLKLM